MNDSVPLQRLDLDDSIMTGQAVSLDISPASPVARVLAGIVDFFAYAFATLLLGSFLFNYVPPSSDSVTRVYTVVLFSVPFIFLPVTVELVTRGRSLGKWALNVQVVRDDGGPIYFRHSLTRALVGIFEVWLTTGAVATLVSLFHRRSKRLGDIAAGTMLVQVPHAQVYPTILMPPGAYEWALRAHILPIPDPVAQRATMFLRSNSGLLPRVRQQTAHVIASELVAYVEPKPPVDLPAEHVIAAILVIRRNQDIRRALRWESYRGKSAYEAAQATYGVRLSDE